MLLTNMCRQVNPSNTVFWQSQPPKQFDTQIVHVKAREWESRCQGVKEMRLSGDTLLTGVLLFESGANRSADGVSI